MTVSTTDSRILYDGNGASTVFNVTFPFLDESDLQVYVGSSLKGLNTDYTVTGGNGSTGTVVFSVAPSSGSANVVIVRDVGLLQETDYQANDPFPAESHERGLDKLTMIAQRIKDLVSRALRLGDSVIGVNTQLPQITGSKLLGTNSNGTGFTFYPLGSEPDTAENIIFTPAGTGSVETTVEEKLRRIVDIMDKGASPSNTKAQNRTALQTAITDVNAAGGGVVTVPFLIDYGFVESDVSTQPDFTGMTTDIIVIDYSLADADPAGNKTGAQARNFYYTAQTSPAGMHNGNGHIIFGNWHPYYSVYNTANLAAVGHPSRLASDNRRASLLFGNDDQTTYRIGQGTLAGAGYTNEELSNFVLEHYATDGDTLGNYAPLTIERKTGNWSVSGGTNAPQAALHVKSPSAGFVQGMYESLGTTCTLILRTSTGASDDVGIRNLDSKFEVFFDTGVAMQVNQTTRNIGIGTDASASYRLDLQATSSGGFVGNIKNNSATNGNGLILDTSSTSGVGWSFVRMFSDNQTDEKYKLRGDGTATADVAWVGGGADRAEMFEWLDGNPLGIEGHKSEVGSNRVGHSVSLQDGKIKICEAGEVPIGVVSLTYDSLGNNALNWVGKFLKDDFGQYLLENCETVSWIDRVKLLDYRPPIDPEYITVFDPKAGRDVKFQTKYGQQEQKELWKEIPHSYYADKIPDGIEVPDDVERKPATRRVLNPEYSEGGTYVPRDERKEWDAVGILGICRLRKGSITAPNWIKMRDISETVEEWFVR